MSSTAVKRGRKPTLRNSTILALREAKVATARELGVSAAYLACLDEAGYVARVGRVSNGHRGRPQTSWKLTKRGQGVGLNLAKRVSA